MKILGLMVIEEAGYLNVPKFNFVLYDIFLESIKIAMVLDEGVGIVDELGDELSNSANSG